MLPQRGHEVGTVGEAGLTSGDRDSVPSVGRRDQERGDRGAAEDFGEKVRVK